MDKKKYRIEKCIFEEFSCIPNVTEETDDPEKALDTYFRFINETDPSMCCIEAYSGEDAAELLNTALFNWNVKYQNIVKKHFNKDWFYTSMKRLRDALESGTSWDSYDMVDPFSVG